MPLLPRHLSRERQPRGVNALGLRFREKLPRRRRTQRIRVFDCQFPRRDGLRDGGRALGVNLNDVRCAVRSWESRVTGDGLTIANAASLLRVGVLPLR